MAAMVFPKLFSPFVHSLTSQLWILKNGARFLGELVVVAERLPEPVVKLNERGRGRERERERESKGRKKRANHDKMNCALISYSDRVKVQRARA